MPIFIHTMGIITFTKALEIIIVFVYLKGWNCGISHSFSMWNSSEAATGKKLFQFFQVLFLHLESRRDPSFKAPLIRTIKHKHIKAIWLGFPTHLEVLKRNKTLRKSYLCQLKLMGIFLQLFYCLLWYCKHILVCGNHVIINCGPIKIEKI